LFLTNKKVDEMLAILTTGHITITEHTALRRAPATLTPSCQVPLSAYVSSVWSPDNGSLYVATTDSVNRYDASGTLVKSLWPLSDGDDIPLDDVGGLAVKDKGTLILSMGNTVHMVEHSSSASSPTKVVQTLPVHPDSSPIHALSLSHDSTLLTVASPNAVVVHNLALGTQTALRKLPGRVAVCTFHVHSRVRLLLGIGHKLVIYDITRPSGPSRVTSIGDGVAGDVVAMACSPYSKTLIAVACSGGYIALVDLDKELRYISRPASLLSKLTYHHSSRIRSFHYKVSVTSLLFSVDGASLYIGTEDGKLLVQTLRSTEPPKTIAVGEQGCRVEGLAITVLTSLVNLVHRSHFHVEKEQALDRCKFKNHWVH
jgi:protein NEDD1